MLNGPVQVLAFPVEGGNGLVIYLPGRFLPVSQAGKDAFGELV